MNDELKIGRATVVTDTTVPPGMVVVKQGTRIMGAIYKGVVFGTADIIRMQSEIVQQLRERLHL